MDIAAAFWQVLLGTQYPLINDLLEYITVCACLLFLRIGGSAHFMQEKGTYKIVTKDVWAMVSCSLVLSFQY